MKLDAALSKLLACPVCRVPLADLRCDNCDKQYPSVNGIPILINEDKSVFRTEDILGARETTYRNNSRIQRSVKRLLPSISVNVNAKSNYKKFFARICANATQPKVLVIGGAVTGAGLENIPKNILFLETDVALGPRTSAVCDAHDLPFGNRAFDGVIAQAVLEHVLDPIRCVSEIHRVLVDGGLIYAETPFMQQVHGGRYDFTRFSYLGHRYLFCHFDEVASGACSGPGTALAWSYCYFLRSLFRNETARKVAFAIGSLTGFWLKYFDYYLIRNPAAADAASCLYFLGSKGNDELSGVTLISKYWTDKRLRE
jgi:SAM-dependent methyltransferase/uncharacterized protein YbaR (Trm112 family)